MVSTPLYCALVPPSSPRPTTPPSSRASGLECLIPPASDRTRYSGETYKPTKRVKKGSQAVEPPAEEGPSDFSIAQAGPSHASSSVSGRENAEAGPSLLASSSDLSFLPLQAGPSSTALVLLSDGCPPSDSWDPFFSSFSPLPSSNLPSAPPTPTPASSPLPAALLDLLSHLPFDSTPSGGEILQTAWLELGPRAMAGSAGGSVGRANLARTRKYFSPDTLMIQQCCAFVLLSLSLLSDASALIGSLTS